MEAGIQPYLSVVVTTRNDGHGGDPLKRLQALVSSFDEQCRRTGLAAEVVVVEWNPPAGKPRVCEMLALPARPACDYRFIEVPAERHARLRHADVLPLFQMIAKNVGIRRARGQFVLSTNIDIVLSSELVAYLAHRLLEPRVLYRVDRHDVEAQIPLDATLDAQMAYCASHQLRTHGRWGTRPVDPMGLEVVHAEDIVDGAGVKLGDGWHVKEMGTERPYRWAGATAAFLVDVSESNPGSGGMLVVDLESNPYDPDSWVEIAVCRNRANAHCGEPTRIRGRRRLRIPLPEEAEAPTTEIQLVVADSSPASRRYLPLYERRDGLIYRVYSAALANSAEELEQTTAAARRSRFARLKEAMADGFARWAARLAGEGLRNRIARSSSEFRTVQDSLQRAESQLGTLAPLQEISHLHEFLREHRPVNLHVNACGDFQLLAREQWEELQGYPELETFSMNIDGLFSYVAEAAGVREQLLTMPIYHLEHEVGSGWSPEGEATLRARIAERGITWLDAPTVYIWAAYMRWLGRPLFFNQTNWGMAQDNLVERAPVQSPAAPLFHPS